VAEGQTGRFVARDGFAYTHSTRFIVIYDCQKCHKLCENDEKIITISVLCCVSYTLYNNKNNNNIMNIWFIAVVVVVMPCDKCGNSTKGCVPLSLYPPFIRRYFQPNRGKNINHNFYIAPDTLKCEAFADIERELEPNLYVYKATEGNMNFSFLVIKVTSNVFFYIF
jgi:hypothetical protein